MNIPGLVYTLSFNVKTRSAAFFCWFSSLSLSLTFCAASAQARTLTVLFLRQERDTFSCEELEEVLEDSSKEELDW